MSVLIHPQYVVDAAGRRRSVLLSVEEFNALLERGQEPVELAAPGAPTMQSLGYSEEEAARLSAEFSAFSDWDDPAMDVYDRYVELFK